MNTHPAMRRSIRALTALSCSLALVACGGGGSESAAPASPPSPPPATSTTAPPPPPPTAFVEIKPPPSFNWSTVASTSNPTLVLRKANGGVGAVRLVISNFIEVDPTGSGALIEPMSTDVIVSALTPAGSASPHVLQLPDLRLPTAVTEVLVEVFSLSDSERLAWRKVKVADLFTGTVDLSI